MENLSLQGFGKFNFTRERRILWKKSGISFVIKLFVDFKNNKYIYIIIMFLDSAVTYIWFLLIFENSNIMKITKESWDRTEIN